MKQVLIDGAAISKQFQAHVNKYYNAFCESAIRHMFTCGFVPWRLRRLATGDPVPEAIPLGLFTWTVHNNLCTHETTYTNSRPFGSSHARQMRAMRRAPKPTDNEESKMLVYRIHFTENCGVSENDVEIYEFIPPSNNITHNSLLYRTVPSPMAHILNDYRNLRQAMIRRGFADSWNTQAKMVCSYQSAKNPYGVSEGNPITNDWAVPQNRLGLTTDTNLPGEIEQNAYARDAITETLVSSKESMHRPTVYTLPKNTKLEPVQALVSSVDTDGLQLKLAKDITSIMGIPFELVGGGELPLPF